MSATTEPPKAIVVSKKCEDKMELVKVLISHYYTTIRKTIKDIDKEVLAFYMIHGFSKETDKKILATLFSHLDISIARQTMYNCRQRLKNDKVILFEATKRIHYITSPLNLIDYRNSNNVTYVLQLIESK